MGYVPSPGHRSSNVPVPGPHLCHPLWGGTEGLQVQSRSFFPLQAREKPQQKKDVWKKKPAPNPLQTLIFHKAKHKMMFNVYWPALSLIYSIAGTTLLQSKES